MEAQGSLLTNKYAEGTWDAVGMEDAKMSMRLKSWQSTGSRNYLGPSTPT